MRLEEQCYVRNNLNLSDWLKVATVLIIAVSSLLWYSQVVEKGSIETVIMVMEILKLPSCVAEKLQSLFRGLQQKKESV